MKPVEELNPTRTLGLILETTALDPPVTPFGVSLLLAWFEDISNFLDDYVCLFDGFTQQLAQFTTWESSVCGNFFLGLLLEDICLPVGAIIFHGRC